MDLLDYLQTLGERFHGVTLDFRRSGTDWPAPWRVRLVSTKNEREEYRVECFGNTAQQAIDALRAIVAKIDKANCYTNQHPALRPFSHQHPAQRAGHGGQETQSRTAG